VSFSLEGGKKVGICGRYVRLPHSLCWSVADSYLISDFQNWIRQIFDSLSPLPSRRPRTHERINFYRRARRLNASSSSATRLDEVTSFSSASPSISNPWLMLSTLTLLQHRHSRSLPHRHSLPPRQPRSRRPLLGQRDLGGSPICWNE